MTTAQSPYTPTPMLWDIFCRVIDNFGDLGVCWRLSADLARRGHRVRLWVDDASALQWMAPGALQGEWLGVQVLRWEQAQNAQTLAGLAPADVWIEGFGCDIAPEFIAAHAYSTWAPGLNDSNFPVWINLEYLSAEAYVERAHTLTSPVMQGAAKGHSKYFFYPGFTQGTGGLLREPGLPDAHQKGDDTVAKRRWLAQRGVDWQSEFLVSLFCYEPAHLAQLLQQWAAHSRKTRLLVTAGRAALAVQTALASLGPLSTDCPLQITYMPALSQADFDELLACCDLNFVRGEDSLVRAIWAGKPFVWHIYPQDDQVHLDKLDAFMNMLEAPASLRHFHAMWNRKSSSSQAQPFPQMDLSAWQACALAARARLIGQSDLTTQLINFTAKNR